MPDLEKLIYHVSDALERLEEAGCIQPLGDDWRAVVVNEGITPPNEKLFPRKEAT